MTVYRNTARRRGDEGHGWPSAAKPTDGRERQSDEAGREKARSE